MKSKTCLHFDFLPAGRACAPAPRAASIVFPSFPKRNTCGATLDQPAPQFQTGLQRSRPRKSAGPEACAKETVRTPCTHCTAAHYVSAPIHYPLRHGTSIVASTSILERRAFCVSCVSCVIPLCLPAYAKSCMYHHRLFDVIRFETGLVECNGITVYKKVHARILIPKGFGFVIGIWDSDSNPNSSPSQQSKVKQSKVKAQDTHHVPLNVHQGRRSGEIGQRQLCVLARRQLAFQLHSLAGRVPDHQCQRIHLLCKTHTLGGASPIISFRFRCSFRLS